MFDGCEKVTTILELPALKRRPLSYLDWQTNATTIFFFFKQAIMNLPWKLETHQSAAPQTAWCGQIAENLGKVFSSLMLSLPHKEL